MGDASWVDEMKRILGRIRLFALAMGSTIDMTPRSSYLSLGSDPRRIDTQRNDESVEQSKMQV